MGTFAVGDVVLVYSFGSMDRESFMQPGKIYTANESIVRLTRLTPRGNLGHQD